MRSFFDQLGRVIIVAKNEDIAKAIAADPYLKERKAPTPAKQQLYLKEVSSCPLCGKIIQHRKQEKANKLYEIAHIFPNRPTEEQYKRLSALPRLGDNSESFENKIVHPAQSEYGQGCRYDRPNRVQSSLHHTYRF